MSEDNIVKILVALIALGGTILGFISGMMAKARKQAVVDAKREQEQKDQFKRMFDEMDAIKKRLDTHNHYAEKIGDIEISIVSIKKDIEYIRKDKQ